MAYIQRLHKEHHHNLGSRRMTLYINHETHYHVNHKRVRRLMLRQNIRADIRRKRPDWKRSVAEHIEANKMNREFTTEKANEKWATDLSQLSYGPKKEYKVWLSAIIDLYCNSILRWQLNHSGDTNEVKATFEGAFKIAPGVHPMVQTDRGALYTSREFGPYVTAHELNHSMSRVGKCIDNGCIEKFWGLLKDEWFRKNHCDTFEELQKGVEDYIHYYNTRRRQERLNGLTPEEYRNQAI
jgi:transposase InsO family protein